MGKGDEVVLEQRRSMDGRYVGATREIQTETTEEHAHLREQLKSKAVTIANAGENAEKPDLSDVAVGMRNATKTLCKTVWQFLTKLNMQLP